MENTLPKVKAFKDRYLYYAIIFVVSVLALVFLPMVGTTVGLSWNVPNTTVGWIVWIAVRVCVAVINVLLFYSFMQQALLNVQDNENYKEANNILFVLKDDKKIPRSPEKYNKQQWTTKGIFIFIGSLMACIALTQAILSYDYMSLLTYLFTIVMGLIFGILQMKNAEAYWTIEYYQYALMKQKEAEDNGNNNREQDISKSSGTSSEE